MWAELAVTVGSSSCVVVGILLTTVPIMVWVERRGAAFIQDRLGPNRVGPMGLFQPIVDVVKLLFKENLVPARASTRFLYSLAPVIALTVALVTFVVIPFGAGADVSVFGRAAQRAS